MKLVRLLDLEGVRPASDIIKPLVVLDLVLKKSLSLTLANLRSRSLAFTLMQISLVLYYGELVRKGGRLVLVSFCIPSLFGTPSSHRSETATSKLVLHLLRLIGQIRLQELTIVISFLNYPLTLLLIIHHLSHNLCGYWIFFLFELGFNLSLFAAWRYYFLLRLCRGVIIGMPTVKRHRG